MNARLGVDVDPAAVDGCVLELEHAIGTVFDGLRAMARAMESSWQRRRRGYTADEIGSFQPAIFEQLDSQRTFDSAGYVLSESALAGTRRHLEWWRRGDGGTFQPLILNVEPGGPDCYDYYSMDWFFAAVGEQRRVIAGPHIDLPCADVCIMTFSEPIVVVGPDGEPEVLGVAAADVALARFESMILPPLRRLPAPAVLANRQRRVITSNDALYIAGDKLPSTPVEGREWQAVRPLLSDVGWTLAVRR